MDVRDVPGPSSVESSGRASSLPDTSMMRIETCVVRESAKPTFATDRTGFGEMLRAMALGRPEPGSDPTPASAGSPIPAK